MYLMLLGPTRFQVLKAHVVSGYHIEQYIIGCSTFLKTQNRLGILEYLPIEVWIYRGPWGQGLVRWGMSFSGPGMKMGYSWGHPGSTLMKPKQPGSLGIHPIPAQACGPACLLWVMSWSRSTLSLRTVAFPINYHISNLITGPAFPVYLTFPFPHCAGFDILMPQPGRQYLCGDFLCSRFPPLPCVHKNQVGWGLRAVYFTRRCLRGRVQLLAWLVALVYLIHG